MVTKKQIDLKPLEKIENYGIFNLQLYPKVVLKYLNEMEKLGIKKTILQARFEDLTSCEKELTVYMGISSSMFMTEDYSAQRAPFVEKILRLEGVRQFSYFYMKRLREKEYGGVPIFLTSIKGERVNSVEIARYFKERNILILEVDFFSYINLDEIEEGKKNEVLEMIMKPLLDYHALAKFEEVDATKWEESKIKEIFIRDASKKLEQEKQTLKDIRNDIKAYEKELVEQYKREIENMKTIETLKELRGNYNELLDKQIREIKELPFVKNVDLSIKGIGIEVGEIDIDGIIIGDFKLFISPQQIKIENLKPLKTWNGMKLEHPHMDGHSICYGNRGNKVTELLGKSEYKKLVYFLYLFLKSYNSEDKYFNIEYWKKEFIRADGVSEWGKRGEDDEQEEQEEEEYDEGGQDD